MLLGTVFLLLLLGTVINLLNTCGGCSLSRAAVALPAGWVPGEADE